MSLAFFRCSLALLGAAALFCGCGTARYDWQRAEEAGTIGAYDYFLTQHYRAPQAALARERIRALACQSAWTKAETANTTRAYDDFIREYPDREQARSALQKKDAILKALRNCKVVECTIRSDYVLDEHPPRENWSWNDIIEDVVAASLRQSGVTLVSNASAVAHAHLTIASRVNSTTVYYMASAPSGGAPGADASRNFNPAMNVLYDASCVGTMRLALPDGGAYVCDLSSRVDAPKSVSFGSYGIAASGNHTQQDAVQNAMRSGITQLVKDVWSGGP